MKNFIEKLVLFQKQTPMSSKSCSLGGQEKKVTGKHPVLCCGDERQMNGKRIGRILFNVVEFAKI